MRILIVDDDSVTAKSVEMMLKSEGYVCDCADLGEDGLEIAKLYDYDVIILDLMLPDIDGYEVLRRLRAARVRTPVLILSGLTERDKKIKGLNLGADDYLTKPFDTDELIARIQAIVRRSKGYSGSVIRTGKLSIDLNKRMAEQAYVERTYATYLHQERADCRPCGRSLKARPSRPRTVATMVGSV